jgi:alanine dehydrogenase
VLFTYFHLAASRALTDAMLASGAHCFAYETLKVEDRLPLLAPMSEVAGRMAVQAGAFYLEAHNGGRGLLLGGVPGVLPAKVLVLGGGSVGIEAAKMAAGLGANVIVMDIDLDRLRHLADILPANVTTLASSRHALRELLPGADLVIGAVLVSGARAPVLINRADLALMQDDGPVLVDVAIDQGGCFETSRPTTHAEPTYMVDGVVHYCVANIPGAVPRTATFALTNATKPYVELLARLLAEGGPAAAAAHPVLGTAANVLGGELTQPAVAAAFDLAWRAPAEALA